MTKWRRAFCHIFLRGWSWPPPSWPGRGGRRIRLIGRTVDDRSEMGFARDFDDRSLKISANGDFEIIFSAKRPASHTGNWAEIAPQATAMVLRYRMVDWEKERDPQLSIECLEPVGPKPRLKPEEIVERIRQM